jgi:hypothetical protein
VGRLADFLRSPFNSLLARSSKEDQLSAYVIREHALGRTVEDILDDPYLKNRSTADQRRRLLERPEVIKALAAQSVGKHDSDE